jgi:hypothetical protein
MGVTVLPDGRAVTGETAVMDLGPDAGCIKTPARVSLLVGGVGYCPSGAEAC